VLATTHIRATSSKDESDGVERGENDVSHDGKCKALCGDLLVVDQLDERIERYSRVGVGERMVLEGMSVWNA